MDERLPLAYTGQQYFAFGGEFRSEVRRLLRVSDFGCLEICEHYSAR
jgi:hypothetical protein